MFLMVNTFFTLRVYNILFWPFMLKDVMTSTLTLQGISTFVSIFSYLFSGYIINEKSVKAKY